MAKWTNTTSYPNLPAPADDDLVPIADVSATAGSQQRTITWSQLTGLQASELGDLTDVDVYGVSDGQVLTFDSATGDWVAETPAAGGDVSGPASAVDDRIATFDGITGKTIQDGGYTIAELAAIPVGINAQTGITYTLALSDAGKLVTLNNGSAITLTVPTNASVAFPVGTVIACAQLGAGLVSIEGDTGVAINGTTPGAEAASSQYATWSLTKLATDTWLASGGLA